MEAGNNLEQSVALIAAANKVVQDPNSVGSALRTISLRLRGTSVKVLEEMGEETDGAVESVSKMQEKIKALTGVDIIDMNGAYKDTYTILQEIGQVWEDMSDVDQAALLELMAGKNRANTLAAILGNMEDLKGAYESALNAEGSAMRENEAYLDSIQGKIDLFNNTLQTFWMNLINSDVIKGVVDTGTSLLKFADTFIGKLTAITAAITIYRKIKDKKTFAEMFDGAGKGISSFVGGLKNITASAAGSQTALQGLWSVIKSNPLIAAAVLATGFAIALDALTTTAQEAADAAKEAFDEIQSVVQTSESTIKELESELSSLKGKIDEFDGKKLSFADEQELERLQGQRKELEHTLKVQNNLLKLQRDAQNKQAIASMEAYTKAASQGAEKTQNAWTTAGKIIGGIVGAAGVVASVLVPGDFGTIGAGAVAAGKAIASFKGLAAIGSFASLGGKGGELIGSKATENDGTYDAWYKTYTDAIDTARAEEEKALAKYQKDPGNIKKLDAWREAQQKTIDIETEMYDHLYQMQQYYNGLEYGQSEEIDQKLDEWNNFLDMMSIDQKATDAKKTALDRIFGDNASDEIQTIKKQILDAISAGEDFDFQAAINGCSELKSILDYVVLDAQDVKKYFTQLGEEVAKGPEDFDITKYTSRISAIGSNISEYQSALESLESGSFTMSDFVSLIEQFPELANGVDVSSKSFTGLAKNLRKAIRNSPDDLIDDLKDLKDELQAAGKETDGIEELITSLENMPVDTVSSLANEYASLADQIDNAKRAQNELQEAMSSNPDEGFETRGSALDQMKALMEEGKIGSESELWDIADAYGFSKESAQSIAEAYGFTYDSAASIHENADALATFISLRQRWYKTDEDGNYTYEGTENFLNDAEKVIAASKELESVKWNYNEDTGTLDIDFANQDWDKIVDVLGKSKELAGLTSDEFYDLLMRVGQFHNINWQDSDDLLWYLDKLNKDVESTKEKFENTENAVKSFVTSEGYSIDILELSVDSEEFKQLPEEIQKVLNRYHEIKTEFEQDPLAINFQLSKDTEKNLKDGLTKESLGALSQLTDVIHDADTGVSWVSFADLSKKAKEAGMDMDVLGEKIRELSKAGKLIDLHTTADDPLGLKAMQADAQSTTNYLKALGVQASELDGAFTIGVPSFIDLMVAAGWDASQISAYISSLSAQGYTFTYTTEENKVETLDVNTEEGQAKVNELVATSDQLTSTETVTVNLDGTAEGAIATMSSTLSSMTASAHNVHVNIITNGSLPDIPGAIGSGIVGVNGTAHAKGSWGAPKTETALVGELGPEMLVRDGHWTTIGDNGAEFTQIKKGDIIFNHKQTKDLLSKGYVAGRGKLHGGAFASGTAYVKANSTFGRYEFDDDGGWKEYDVNDEVVDSIDGITDATKKISNAIDEAAESVEEFEEVLDFIEIRMEEFDERIGKLSAELENLTTYAAKNAHLDKIIAENQKKYSDSLAGAKYYEEFAQKYLKGMNDDLVAAAKNGAIAITEFTKEQDQATIEAIQNYRDYAQKAADLYQQAEEILTEIRDSVIQKIDNIQSYGDAKVTIEDLQTEKLQNKVDYWETKGEIPASAYYGVNGGNAATSTGMFENSYKKIEYWTPLLEDMQKEFNDAVKSGKIEVGTIEWYEQLEKLYTVQSEIDAATIEIEEFQNAINDLYWDNFDQLINRLDYLKDETQNLIDLMDSEDMVVDPVKKKYENGTIEFWTADDVKWSKEGLASLGLYAQQMEIAEYKSKQYAEAIDDLTKEYKAGHYSENEYYEKLNELKGAQYDSIEAYYDAQDTIKDLNATRIDSIKKGIDKEIEAYEELIKAKKELLASEKDAHDFQKTVLEQQKNISDIERKLAALAYDNSGSARAQRAKLEAELAEARTELDEIYYDRSIEEQQNALDKELENFQKEKDAEVEKMEEYLEDIKQVVADSLMTVQENASGIYETLSGKAEEYNLTLSESIMTPWQDGSLAVSSYQETFDTAMSSTMDQLDALKNKWQEVIDKMSEAGKVDVININQENANYASAKKTDTSNTDTKTSSQHGTYTVRSGDNLWSIAEKQLGSGSRWKEIYNLNKDIISNPDIIQPGWNLKIPKYAKGTLSVPKDQLSILDELGEELRLIPDGNGRLAYMKKGTGVVPADLTANLMEWGKLDPTTMLDQNRPEIGVSPSVVNNTTEIHIDASVGELLHVEHLDGNNPAEISKIVDKAWDKRMKELNGYVRRYVR